MPGPVEDIILRYIESKKKAVGDAVENTGSRIDCGRGAVDEAAVLACVAVPRHVLTSYNTDTATATAPVLTTTTTAAATSGLQVPGLVSAFLGVGVD